MNIQPIVEGHGEVGASSVLLRRLRDEIGAFGIDVNPPIRRNRSQLTTEVQLRTSIKLARAQVDCGAILILFDSDDDCPAELGPLVQSWAQEEATPIPCVAVLANREYEAWFLAAIESLRGVRGIRKDADSHPDPESPRNAKGQIEKRMTARRSYSEVVDQPALTAKFDLALAHQKCRSFRHLVKAFGELAVALGATLPDPWPPSEWETE